MILKRVASREDAGIMAAVVIAGFVGGAFLKRTFELTFIQADFFPMAFNMAEKVIGASKPPQAILTNVRTQGGL